MTLPTVFKVPENARLPGRIQELRLLIQQEANPVLLVGSTVTRDIVLLSVPLVMESNSTAFPAVFKVPEDFDSEERLGELRVLIQEGANPVIQGVQQIGGTVTRDVVLLSSIGLVPEEMSNISSPTINPGSLTIRFRNRLFRWNAGLSGPLLQVDNQNELPNLEI